MERHKALTVMTGIGALALIAWLIVYLINRKD